MQRRRRWVEAAIERARSVVGSDEIVFTEEEEEEEEEFD